MKRIIVLSLILLFSSCGKKDDSIKIGVILPLTGEVATYGQAVKMGIDIAIENEKSIVVKTFFEDSKAQKITSLYALENLFSKNVNFFIGDATSTVTYEIGPRIQAKGKLLIVPIATGDKIREIGNNIFMISPRNEKQTTKIIEFIKINYSDKKIGCFFKQNDYGVNIANTFFKSFPDIYSQAYQEGQDDFRSLLLKFKKEKVEVIFVPGNYQETASILKQTKEINYDVIYIGTDGCYSPKLIELALNTSENFLLTMMPIDYNSEMYLEFEKVFKEKWNRKPDIFSCYGYESALILLEALKKSPNISTQEVSKYLHLNSFRALTGDLGLKFDSFGEADRDYQIYKVKNGDFIPF